MRINRKFSTEKDRNPVGLAKNNKYLCENRIDNFGLAFGFRLHSLKRLCPDATICKISNLNLVYKATEKTNEKGNHFQEMSV